MDKQLLTELKLRFDKIEQPAIDGGVEYWYARDLMGELGYDRWENFSKVIEKAVSSCVAASIEKDNHFQAVTKKVKLGNDAERLVDDIMLTRYACYLIAQNGDPRKQEIAFAQAYFAVQTRKQEVLEERLHLRDRLDARKKLTESETELSRNIYERGVDGQGFARIRSKGDAALFGGNNTQAMKTRLDVPSTRPLADFLPTVTLAAKNLATEMTNHNVKQNDLKGEPSISGEHVQNNKSVRDMLGDRGIKPEQLPPEEDLKKLERRVNGTEKKLGKAKGLLKGKKGATE